MAFEQPFLLARVAPAKAADATGAAGLESSAPFSARSFHAQFTVAGVPTARIHTPAGEVAIFLAGELHDLPGPDPAASALDAYLARGPDFVTELHGSFAIVVADAREDSLYVLTDPVNSRAVFHLHADDVTWIGTAPAFPTLRSLNGEVDETAVAQYMVNGIPLNNRTLFRGIRIMKRAGIHRFVPGGWNTRTYWSAEYRSEPIDLSEGKNQLADLLTAAVRRRIADHPHAFVSLSGGYDSPAILCLMHRLGYREVRCFSYAGADERTSGDAQVARALCRSLGYEHTVVPAYRASLFELLDDNAKYGRGLTRLIVEIDAWKQIGSLMAGSPSPVLFAGDECFGGPYRPAVVTEEDVLSSLGIVGLSGVGWLAAWLPSETVRRWEHELRAELLGIVNIAANRGNPHDLDGFLYLDQRLARILAWRENVGGYFARVRLPLLDRDLLQFMQRTPTNLRLSKRLSCETVTELFPQAFQAPRAAQRGSMIRRWADQVVRAEGNAIRELIVSQSSPLDEYIAPDALLSLLKRCGRPSWSRWTVIKLVRKAKRLKNNRGGSRPYAGPRGPVPESVLLVRALFLRRLLANSLSDERGRVTLTGTVGHRSSGVTALR